MSIRVAPKDPNVPKSYEIDVFFRFISEMHRSREFKVNDLARAPRDTGFYYKCTVAGRTSRSFPRSFPRVDTETLLDGSVTWTTIHPDSATAAVKIQTVDWTVPAGLTLDSQSESGHIAEATFSGGLDGEDYEVTARVTPNNGNAIDITITIPVRQQ